MLFLISKRPNLLLSFLSVLLHFDFRLSKPLNVKYNYKFPNLWQFPPPLTTEQSKLCYDQVIPLLHNSMKDSTIYLPGQTECEKCTHPVTLHLSNSEYDTLMKKANGSPLSRYVRNALLYRSEPIRIEVYTEDISALSIQVSGYIQKLHNFIAALAIRRQLYEADYNHLIQIANDTQKALRDVANYVKANRSSIRAAGVRILRQVHLQV